MSDSAVERVSRWLIEPCQDRVDAKHWSCGVASDMLALEQRVAALEGNSSAIPNSSPAADGEALRAECDRLRAENAALRQRLAAPIDVEAFREEFEKLLEAWDCSAARHHLGPYEWIYSSVAWGAVNAFAARLNAAARKAVVE